MSRSISVRSCRATRSIRIFFCTAALLGSLSLPQTSTAKKAIKAQCFYDLGQLTLRLTSDEPRTVYAKSQPIRTNGSPVGKPASKTLKLGGKSTPQAFRLDSHRTRDHRVFIRDGKDDIALYCRRDRGSWSAGPKSLSLKAERIESDSWEKATAGMGKRLAAGYRAKVQSNKKNDHLTIERTLGNPASGGIRVPSGSALISALKGSPAAIFVTLIERRGRKLRYWDYPLGLSTKFRHISIPIKAFVLRGSPQNVPPKRIHVVAFRTRSPAGEGESLEIATLRLGKAASRVLAVQRKGEAYRVKVDGAKPSSSLEVGWDEGASSASQSHASTVHHTTVTFSPPSSARRFWICSMDRTGSIKLCDPPDAPLSAYVLPKANDHAYTIDAFDTPSDVNAHRQLIRFFGSSWKTQHNAAHTRGSKGLTLGFTPSEENEYIGYETALPSTLPAHMRAVELRVGERDAVKYASLSMTTKKGLRARIPLAHYVYPQSKTTDRIRVPLRAFDTAFEITNSKQRKNRWKSLSIALSGQRVGKPVSLNLRSLSFVSTPTPLAIASFDAAHPRQTAVMGGQFIEHGKGGSIMQKKTSRGRFGKALRVAVSLNSSADYALVGFGLGKLDVTRYAVLEFWLRAEQGNDAMEIQFSANKNRYTIPLRRVAKMNKKWKRVSVPLTNFGIPANQQKKLTHLILLWRNHKNLRQTVYVDQIRLLPIDNQKNAQASASQ